MLVLADDLLSLGKDRQLLVWTIGQYDQPQVLQLLLMLKMPQQALSTEDALGQNC